MIIRVFYLLLALFLCADLVAQPLPISEYRSDAERSWVDSMYNLMSEDERIGQLIMIRAHSNLGPDHIAEVDRLVRDFRVGGLCFFQGTPERQAELTNRYQMLSPRVPLLVSMDAEWGLNMRLKEAVISFPRQLMLGAIREDSLIYQMGFEIARQCRRLGVHVDFAPVADVNVNPNNPVINDRSFGEDRLNVTTKCYAYMKGLQDGNVMACAKHFPGHGDTDMDSHFDLPPVLHDITRLDSIELFPFRVLSQQGIMSMMVAHLNVPAIDNRTNIPTSMSDKTITDLLINQIGFDGLIFTDGMEMKGLTNSYPNGEATAMAILAGNDVALLPQNVPDGIAAIKRYIVEGKLTWDRVSISTKKILAAKYRLGLAQYQPVSTYNIREELNSYTAKNLKRALTESALTLVRNEQSLLPIQQIETGKYASISMGTGGRTAFQEYLNKYVYMPTYSIGNTVSDARKAELMGTLKGKTVIVSLHDMKNKAEQQFGLSKSQIDFVNELTHQANVILVVFGNPYSLRYFDEVSTLIEAYNEDPITQELTAQAIFGAIGFKGMLPITASPRSKFGMGDLTSITGRIRYDLPERVGLRQDVLDRIDAIAQEAISTHATPGCQILVMKDGAVVFQKGYGTHTYEAGSPATTTDDIFDLASITKICATTLSVMKLVEEGRVNLDAPLSDYVPYLKGTNKEYLKIRDIMAHHAGLTPWIPFYKTTMTFDGRETCPSPDIYSFVCNDEYCLPVCNGLYMKKSYADIIKKAIADSDLRPNTNYKYSDLGFIMLADLIKNVTGKTLDEYAAETFYRPLGMGRTQFNPWETIPDSLFVPTEDDKYFRMKPVTGYVHDMGAAMLGGVSGHAGLFSTSTDLAILAQMWLNGGEYAGTRYLQPETIKQFTTRYPRSTRRGIGFDMRELSGSESANVSNKCSSNTYGHTGFTGNCIWIDPDSKLVFIFLSNRTFPSMENNRLINGDYRPRIQSVVYDAKI